MCLITRQALDHCSNISSSSSSNGTEAAALNHTLSHGIKMAHTQQPQLVVQLAGQHTSGAAGAGAGGAWLQLSPDSMHQHRLASQQTMLVRWTGRLYGTAHPQPLKQATLLEISPL
jgi:hypothetical protein